MFIGRVVEPKDKTQQGNLEMFDLSGTPESGYQTRNWLVASWYIFCGRTWYRQWTEWKWNRGARRQSAVESALGQASNPWLVQNDDDDGSAEKVHRDTGSEKVHRDKFLILGWYKMTMTIGVKKCTGTRPRLVFQFATLQPAVESPCNFQLYSRRPVALH